MKLFDSIKNWYSAQTDSTKAMIWIGLVCIVGIILRWDAVVAGIAKGFNFYSTK